MKLWRVRDIPSHLLEEHFDANVSFICSYPNCQEPVAPTHRTVIHSKQGAWRTAARFANFVAVAVVTEPVRKGQPVFLTILFFLDQTPTHSVSTSTATVKGDSVMNDHLSTVKKNPPPISTPKTHRSSSHQATKRPSTLTTPHPTGSKVIKNFWLVLFCVRVLPGLTASWIASKLTYEWTYFTHVTIC